MVGNYKRSIDFMWQCTLNMAEEGINIWPLQISAPLRSTTWIGKTIRFIWLFRPKTAEITIRYIRATSITFKYMVDKLEQSWATVHKEYCQNGGQKKKAARKKSYWGKNSAGNLGGIHGSCSEKPILWGLHDWKVSAHYYLACIPTKQGKFEIIIQKQTKITKTN